MSSTCFDPEGSSSGRRLHVQVWYSVLYMHQYKQFCTYKVYQAPTLFDTIISSYKLSEDDTILSIHVGAW